MNIRCIASGSSGNCYLVGDGTTEILLDCGIPMRKINEALGFRVTARVVAVLITHAHQDHCKAVKDLLGKGVDCYMSNGTIDALGLFGHRVKPVNALSSYRIGTFHVTTFDVVHDVPEPLGFVLESSVTGEKVLYFVDTACVKYTDFTGITHLMCECNFDEESILAAIENGYLPPEMLPRLLKSHMSLKTLLEFLRANDWSKLRQIYLLHMSDRNSNAERMREAVVRETGVEVYVA